jgi:hypothetical protein
MRLDIPDDSQLSVARRFPPERMSTNPTLIAKP